MLKFEFLQGKRKAEGAAEQKSTEDQMMTEGKDGIETKPVTPSAVGTLSQSQTGET